MLAIRRVLVPVVIWGLFISWFIGSPDRLDKILVSPTRIALGLGALILLSALYQVYDRNWERITDGVYRYRYLVVLVLFVLGISLELTGSSIGIWGDYLHSTEHDRVLFGLSRPIRSDEFATSTAWTFSQLTDPDQFLPYFGDVVRGEVTDMYILLNQPVLDLAMIFKPAHWGYLFLGLEKAFSYHWLFRLFFMIMTLFEFFMIVVEKRKGLALSATLLVAFGPAVQWWSLGGAEVLSMGALAVILVHSYLKTTNYLKRILFATLLGWCATAYALVLYPAWQVPYLYIFVTIALWLFVKEVSQTVFDWKKDIPIISLSVFVVLAGLFYVVTKSWDAIQLTMNTAYPGARQSAGGGDFYFSMATGYPFSIWYPMFGLTDERGMNVFYDFFPLGMLSSLLVWLRKKDSLSACLMILNAFFMAYMLIGIPDSLAKITLMSMTMTQRLIPIFSFLNILLLFRSLSLKDWSLDKRTKGVLAGALTFGVMLFALYSTKAYIETVLTPFASSPLQFAFQKLLVIGLTIGLLYLAFRALLGENNRRIVFFVGLIAFLSGISVNPLRSGADVILDSELVSEIKAIDDAQEGDWIVDGLGYPMTNVPLFAGAPTLNSTNAYPNLELWKSLDPSGQYEEIYNRYAHVLVDLVVDGEPVFELVQPDVFRLALPVDLLDDLQVSYIMSSRDLSLYNQELLTFTLIEEANGIFIYKVTY